MDQVVLASSRRRKRMLLWLRRLHFFPRRLLRHSCYLPCGGFYHCAGQCGRHSVFAKL